MAFCCEVDDVVNVISEDGADTFFVADVSFDEVVVFSVCNLFEVFFVSCIGEFVKVDDFDIVIVGFEEVVDEVGSDESASAGYEVGFHFCFPL